MSDDDKDATSRKSGASIRSQFSVPSITITPELHEQVLPPTASKHGISHLTKKPSKGQLTGAASPQPTSSPLPSPRHSFEDFDDVQVILKSQDNKSQGSFNNDNPDDEQRRKQFEERHAKRHGPKSLFVLYRRQIYTVFWTNLLMRYRMKIITIFEVLIPVFVIWLCVMSLTIQYDWKANERLKSDVEKTKEKTESPLSQSKISTYFCGSRSGRLCDHKRVFVIFTPNDTFTRKLVNHALDQFAHFDSKESIVRGVKTAMEVADICKAKYENTTMKDEKNPEIPDPEIDPVGLVFSYDIQPDKAAKDPNRLLKIPYRLSYEIRTFLTEIGNTLDLFPYLEIPNADGVSPYITTGFVSLQSAIDTAFIEFLVDEIKKTSLILDKDSLPPRKAIELNQDFQLQMFPFTVFLDLKVRHSTWGYIMLSIIFGYFCTTYFTLNRIILHRNAGILKMLKLHGMSSTFHWLSLLFYEIIFHVLTCIGITIIFFQHLTIQGGFFIYNDPFLVFIFLYLHGMAANCFNLFIGSFFKTPVLGSLIGFLISFLSYFVPFNWYLLNRNSNIVNTIFCLLFPNWCLANGIYQLLKFESYDTGVDFSSANKRIDKDKDKVLYPIGYCMLIFTISSIFYFTVTVLKDSEIIEKIRTKLCKKSKPLFPVHYQDEEEGDDEFEKPSVYEEDDINPCHVKLRNVTVVFNNEVIALDNVSTNFHEGQITLILGYNNAGKSTLLNLVSGLIRPTSGKVLIDSVDPYSNYNKLNKKIGFCPKKLSLFPSLSVEEHIRLCCMLHGNSIEISRATSDALLKTFKMYEYRRMGVKSLSQNQLRKLGLAMAMSNNCSVLLLEEPAFGLNSKEKSEIWSSLQKLKRHRTIIVSMGSLEDADAFADRLVLMSQGKIICSGSPSFLSKSYNVGEFIQILKTVEDLHVGQILFFIQLLHPDIGSDFHEVKLTGFEEQENFLYMSVPRNSKFSQILHTLECYKDELGISEIHVIHNTLAGIFYKLSRTMEEDGRSGAASNMHLGTTTTTTTTTTKDKSNKNVNIAEAESDLTANAIGVFHQRRRSSDFASKLLMPSELPTLPYGVEKSPNSLLRLTAVITKHLQNAKQKYKHFLLEYLVSFCLIGIFVYYCESYLTSRPSKISRELGFGTYPDQPVPVRLIPDPHRDESLWQEAFRYISESHPKRLQFYNSSHAADIEFKARRNKTVASRTRIQSQVVTAFQVDGFQDFHGYYASNARHSAPVALNVMNNVILTMLTPKSFFSKGTTVFHIQTFNHPFTLYGHGITRTGTIFDVTNAMCGVLFGFILASIAAPRITLPLLERSSGLKTVQMMSGLQSWEYWLSIYICDLTICIAASSFLTLMVHLFDSRGVFDGVEVKSTIFFLSALYLCWAALPFGYIIGRLISNPYSGVGQYMIIHCLFGSVPVLVTYLVFGTNVTGFAHWVRYVLQIFPSYTITSAFVQLCEQVAERTFCSRQPVESKHKCTLFEEYKSRTKINDLLKIYDTFRIEIDENDIYFQKCCKKFCQPEGKCLTFPGFFEHDEGNMDIFINTMVLFGQGLFYWLLVILLESRFKKIVEDIYKSIFYGNVESAKAIGVDHKVEDADVMYEQEKIKAIIELGIRERDTFIVNNLTKVSRYHKILDHIYFKVSEGSVVGLLGPEKSGKEEIIQILTGSMTCTLGDIIVKGIYLQRNKEEYFKHIGFCPQIPPLLPNLTGLQLMQLIGRLRGIPSRYLTIQAKKWLSLVGISDEHQIYKCHRFRIGQQKLLSFALALIGNPEIVIFDEPTKNLDDHEQLMFWNLITFLKKHGQSVVFTTSSAEECSQICNKVILLNDGYVTSVGSPQDVFGRFPKGWSLMIRLYSDSSNKFPKEEIEKMTDSLKNYIVHTFSPCELTEERDNLLFFHLQDTSKSLSFTYRNMEELKRNLPDFIDEYFIEETNLDDIVISHQSPSPPTPLMLS